MDASSVSQHRESLIRAIPEVDGHITTFRSINKRWKGAITAGMIEAGRMEGEAGRLFGPLIQDMGSTKDKYGEIQSRLIDAIMLEMVRKVVLSITDSAKFAINILKRNLFERTADVGYLATDSDIVSFLRQREGEGDGECTAEDIRARLADYQYEYTVYDEIIILDTAGRVRANLDPDNPVSHSRDPLLEETIKLGRGARDGDDKYVETFRATDLRPGKGDTLIYSQCIEDPETSEILGVLCLCFAFEDEMEGIFKDLNEADSRMIVAILNEDGTVISSNSEEVLPHGSRVAVDLKADFRVLSFHKRPYMVSTVATDGYQGFYGLTWYGLAMVDALSAFKREENGDGEAARQSTNGHHAETGELGVIKMESDDLLADMKLDSINGQVKAARFQADGFVEVLRFVNWIGDEIDGLFATALRNLQQTVVSSLFSDVEFRAFQGNNIADRNLYERANDVCWWALTPLFRRLLAKHRQTDLTDAEREALTANLQYINDLYTPYLRLVLADTDGEVVAVSSPPEELEERFVQKDAPRGQEFVSMKLDSGLVRGALALESSRDYCVSGFEPTPLYGGRPTYIYSTAVRDPEGDGLPVGVIQIVFDSEPQFEAMLQDALPKDADKQAAPGSFGVFVDRDRTVISSTNPDVPVGGRLELDRGLLSGARGERASAVVELHGRTCAVGTHVSHGYREYKCADGYDNEIVCCIFAPLDAGKPGE